MGLQMIGWGALIQANDKWRLVTTTDAGWLWGALTVLGGVWLMTIAVTEAYVNSHWEKVWTQPRRDVYRWLMKSKSVSYFFSGATWGGIGIHAAYVGLLSEVDFLCPLYMVFLLYMAFKDASKKRKHVEDTNENNRSTAALLHSHVGVHGRVHPERLRR